MILSYLNTVGLWLAAQQQPQPLGDNIIVLPTEEDPDFYVGARLFAAFILILLVVIVAYPIRRIARRMRGMELNSDSRAMYAQAGWYPRRSLRRANRGSRKKWKGTF